METKEELLNAINQVNDLTDQSRVKQLKEKVNRLNLNDPNNKEIFELADRKLWPNFGPTLAQ